MFEKLKVSKYMEMESSSIDLFINLIQNNPIVFDKTLKDFKNIRKKEEIWAKIANQSRMSVDSAKKRYFSLRQKYCREKRNLEVKRRNKIVAGKNWIWYGRLHFLDSFIQPRSTFTNDVGFEEDHDEEMTENIDEGGVEESQNFDIQVEKGIDNIELNNFLRDEHNSSNVQQNTSHNFEDSNQCSEEIISEYTGEVLSISYMDTAQNSIFLLNKAGVSDNPTPVATEEEHQQIRDALDLDNYMSPHPSTSSHNDFMNLNSSSQVFIASLRDSAADKTVPVSQENSTTTAERPIIESQLTPNSHTTDGQRSSSQQQMQNSSRRDLSAAKNTTTFRQNRMQSASTSNQTVPSTQKPAPSRTTTTASISNEKTIEVIRHKMDSCLNALSNKITDKTQRSPHAPFLAYLGTKLANVPKEKISDVEHEILELVKFHSK